MARIKICKAQKLYAKRTKCSRRLVEKKSEMKIVLFSCSAETYFRPLPYTFLTPLPPLFPSFLPPLPSSGIFQPCLVLAKSTKKAFSEATRPCTRDICLFWDWGRKSCRPESRRLLQGNVSVRRSLSPAERPSVRGHGGDAGCASSGSARVAAPAPPQKAGGGAEKERVGLAERTG